MPQMSPMMWMILYFYFFLIFYFLNVIFYYFKFYILVKMKMKNYLAKNFYLKW